MVQTIFQTMISINQSLKSQKFTPSGCKDIGIRKFEFAAKNQFLLKKREKRLKDYKDKTA